MWRSVAIGVVLAGVLAGCSWVDSGSAKASLPSAGRVAGVVRQLVDTSQATCTRIGLRVRCDLGFAPGGGITGGGTVVREWFTLRRTSKGWVVRPDCSSDPQDVTCRWLQ